jgi:hypothetical protein
MKQSLKKTDQSKKYYKNYQGVNNSQIHNLKKDLSFQNGNTGLGLQRFSVKDFSLQKLPISKPTVSFH